MNSPQFKLRCLAVMWNELASPRLWPSFQDAFINDLERLNRWPENYPEHLLESEVDCFEARVIRTLGRHFSDEAFSRIRARLAG